MVIFYLNKWRFIIRVVGDIPAWYNSRKILIYWWTSCQASMMYINGLQNKKIPVINSGLTLVAQVMTIFGWSYFYLMFLLLFTVTHAPQSLKLFVPLLYYLHLTTWKKLYMFIFIHTWRYISIYRSINLYTALPLVRFLYIVPRSSEKKTFLLFYSYFF